MIKLEEQDMKINSCTCTIVLMYACMHDVIHYSAFLLSTINYFTLCIAKASL